MTTTTTTTDEVNSEDTFFGDGNNFDLDGPDEPIPNEIPIPGKKKHTKRPLCRSARIAAKKTATVNRMDVPHRVGDT